MPHQSNGRTWLVTGAQGFIGSYLTDCILRLDGEAAVIGTGRSSEHTGCFAHRIAAPQGRVLAPLPPELLASRRRAAYRVADINDRQRVEAILTEFRPTHIVHLAAGLRGDSCRDLIRTNVEGTATLFEAVNHLGKDYRPRILVCSSGAVYGDTLPHRVPLDEEQRCEPIDEYGITKLAAESLASMYAKRLGLPLTIARIFNSFGAGQDERHVAGRIACELARASTEALSAVELGSLLPTRDFIDVRDVARALFTLACDENAPGIVNVGSGEERSVADLLHRFLQVSGVSVSILQRADRPPGVLRHYARIDRLLQTGFRPRFSFEASVAEIWRYALRLWSAASDNEGGCGPAGS